MDINSFDQATAVRAIEHLRYGIPPPEHVRAFTVGRAKQLRALEASLGHPTKDKGSALLVKANYGGGKSHLLRVVREMALDAGYAVSHVVVDAQGGVRFNVMETIFGAISRKLEIRGQEQMGVGNLFDVFAKAKPTRLPREMQRARKQISNNGKWDQSNGLKSPALFVALRAWLHLGSKSTRDLILDWFANPENYRLHHKKRLYSGLIDKLPSAIRDPREETDFYNDFVFFFNKNGHQQAWDALADFHLLAQASGLRGLVLLFDEFEDMIQNLKTRNLREAAYLNLFRFFDGDRFPSMSYFAVTPEFVEKCKTELDKCDLPDFDKSRFDQLPCFAMEPIQRSEFAELAKRIRTVYARAYGSVPRNLLSNADLDRTVQRLWSVSTPNQIRQAIQGFVTVLDDQLNGGC